MVLPLIHGIEDCDGPTETTTDTGNFPVEKFPICHLQNYGQQELDYIWLVVWNIFYFPIYKGNNHPNWLIFFRGVQPPTRYSRHCRGSLRCFTSLSKNLYTSWGCQAHPISSMFFWYVGDDHDPSWSIMIHHPIFNHVPGTRAWFSKRNPDRKALLGGVYHEQVALVSAPWVFFVPHLWQVSISKFK